MSIPALNLCRLAFVLVGLLAALTFEVSTADADYGLEQVSLEFHTPGGEPVTQAGSHPDMSIDFRVNETASGEPINEVIDDGQTRTVITDLPRGFYANPNSVPQCAVTDFAFGSPYIAPCPLDSQVGEFYLESLPRSPGGELVITRFPLYNLSVTGRQAAALGAQVAGLPVGISAFVTSEGGAPTIRTVVENANQGVAYKGIKVTLWGVPADSIHDTERLDLRNGIPIPTNPSGLVPAPFNTMPSDCDQPMVLRMQAASWQEPTKFHEATDELPAPTGCEKLKIKHSFSVQPIERSASQPSGFDVALEVPQDDAPNGLATPPVRRVQVAFPPGLALSPAAANGLEGCSDQQLGLGSDRAPSCPAASKVGTVDVETPLLAKDLEGSVYVGTSTAQNTFRTFIVLEGPGTLFKLPGVIEADERTGQLTAVFDELPEYPFSSMQMHLDGGPGAPLSTPGCGTYTTTSVLTAWSGQVSRANSTMTINQGCDQAGKFEPSLTAGLTNPVAGQPTAFSLRLTRPSGQQAISGLNVTLPPGVLAKVGSVPLCPEAAAASGSCSAASQIGTVTAGAGDGSAPVYVPQPGRPVPGVYLAGPYKGAPYSLSVVVPAQAGPYDLGTVVIRNALRVDPVTAQVTVESDPLPTILKGVPLRIRDIRVDVNRPGFVVGPTNCKAMQVTSTVTSAGGLVAHPSSRFRAAGCGDLGFGPKLSLELSGAPTHRGGHPKLKAVLTARPGDANIGKAVVTLPKTELLENAHIQTICTRPQYAANACPAKSVYGYAKAWSPLLDRPIEGPVYLRANGGERDLPDLVADLDGPIHVDLVGYIDSVNARIRSTFATVPDAPVSKFVLEMKGGDKGLLVNNTEICRKKPIANAKFTGQNGKVSNTNPVVQVACGKRGK